MRLERLASTLILSATVIVLAASAVAQQPADGTQQSPATASTPANTTTPPPTSTSAPSASATTAAAATSSKKDMLVSKDYIKRLRNAGYYPKNDHGKLVFCKKDAPLGTRFATERCMDGEQLAMQLERDESQRQQLRNTVCQGGMSCGGGK